MASRILTITIGKENIKISEVEKTSQTNVRVFNAATIPTPDDSVDEDGVITDLDVISSAISTAISSNGMSSLEVIFSIQSNKIISKEVMTPVLKDVKLKEFIKTNSSEYFPVNIDEYLISHYVLETVREGDNKQLKVNVVAVPDALVQQYYELAIMLGLTVVSMDYSNNSSSQLLAWQIDERGTVVIQMGEDSTTVCIFNNKVPQLIRTVPYGRNTVASAVMDKRNVTYNDAIWLMTTKPILKSSFAEGDYITDSLKYLVNNVGRVIDYFVSKHSDVPVETAIFISEEKSIVGIETLLQEELNIRVDKLEMLNNVALEYNLSVAMEDLTKYIINIGAVINPINFVTAEAELVKKKSSSGKRIRLALIVAVGIAAILVVMPLVLMLFEIIRKETTEADIKEIEDVRVIVNEYYDAKDINSEIVNFGKIASGSDDYLGELFAFLEKEMPSDISIVSMTITNGNVTASCTGSSKDSLASFISVLNESDSISNVYVSSFSESEDYSGGITLNYSVVFSFTDFVDEQESESVEVENNEEEAE